MLAIEIELDHKICLINTYLPTNKPESEKAYTECLDILHDIISRFEQSHQIVICGDLSGTLLPTRNNKHDIMLKNFETEHMLSTTGHFSLKPTFYYFKGVSKSQIDYILAYEQSVLVEYSVGNMELHNVSSHVPARALLKTNYMFKNIQNNSSKHSVQSRKIYSWNKIDTDKYISELESIIPKGEKKMLKNH